MASVRANGAAPQRRRAVVADGQVAAGARMQMVRVYDSASTAFESRNAYTQAVPSRWRFSGEVRKTAIPACTGQRTPVVGVAVTHTPV
eukprot:2134748-Prymnesium_polylepis.1